MSAAGEPVALGVGAEADDQRGNAALWLNAFCDVQPEGFDPFCLAWCAQCRDQRRFTDPVRLANCEANDCGLRNPQKFAEEQAIVGHLLFVLGADLGAGGTPTLHPHTAAIVNTMVGKARCVVPAVVIDANGLVQPGYSAPNLRGWAHGALLRLCYGAAGVVFLNSFQHESAKLAARKVEGNRKEHRELVRDANVLAAFDEDPGRTDREIARLTDVNHRTVAHILAGNGRRRPG